jgi:hypothetical protein
MRDSALHTHFRGQILLVDAKKTGQALAVLGSGCIARTALYTLNHISNSRCGSQKAEWGKIYIAYDGMQTNAMLPLPWDCQSVDTSES